MHGYLKYNRWKEKLIYHELKGRSRGVCVGVLRMLVIHADHATGVVSASLSYIEDGTGYTRQQIRSAIKKLVDMELIKLTPVVTPVVTQQITQRATTPSSSYLIIDYGTWATERNGEEEEVTQEVTPVITPVVTTNNKDTKKDSKKTTTTAQEKIDSLRSSTPEVFSILKKDWVAAGASLPKAAKESTTAFLAIVEVIEALHRIDGLSWDRVSTIVRHAATEWFPKGFIRSPRALRDNTRSGDEKKWEAIESQVKRAGNNTVDNAPATFTPSGLKIGGVHQ